MAPSTPTNDVINSQGVDILNAQLRESYGRVVYTHKVHEKDADYYFKQQNRLKILQIVLSAITTGGLIVTLLGEGRVATVIAAVASAALLCLTTYAKNTDLGALAQKHADSAARLWNVRESYISLLTDIATGDLATGDIRARRDTLQTELDTIYSGSPRTSSKAYKNAQKGLKVNEELTFSDDEIDAFLPPPLRKKTF